MMNAYSQLIVAVNNKFGEYKYTLVYACQWQHTQKKIVYQKYRWLQNALIGKIFFTKNQIQGFVETISQQNLHNFAKKYKW